MANAFTLGGALGSALNSTSGYIKKITSPNDQTLNNLKTGVVSAVKNAPANISSAYNAITNPVQTTQGLIQKAVAPKPAPQMIPQSQIPQVQQKQVTSPVIGKSTGLISIGSPTKPATQSTPAKAVAQPAKQTVQQPVQPQVQQPIQPPLQTSVPLNQPNNYIDAQGNNLPGVGGAATNNMYVPPVYSNETENAYGTMTTDMANRSRQPIKNYDQIQAKLEENAAKQAALEREITAREANIGTSGVDLSLATGERGILSSKAQAGLSSLRSEASALSGMLGAANTQQQTQQSALGNAITAANPRSVAPSDTLVSPTNMQAGYGLGGSNNGSNPYQKWQTLQYNTNTGLEAGGKATQIDIPMRSIDALVPQITSFMDQAGINPTSSTWYNDLVSSYEKGAGNPAGMKAYEGMVNELQTYTRQILGASSNLVTPSAADDIIKKLSVENLNPTNLKEVIATVQQMGEIQKNTLQTTQKEVMSSGTVPYSGRPANVQSGFVTPTKPEKGFINPTDDTGRKAGIAGALGVIPAAFTFVTGLAKGLFNSVTK